MRDAHTKGGTLESGTSKKEKMPDSPESLGMGKNVKGDGDRQRPNKPKKKVGGGFTLY